MKIAITAPTGHIGRKLTDHLLNQGGHSLVLLARDPSKLKDEEKRGAKIAQGNLNDPSFVETATKGVDLLFWLIPPDVLSPDVFVYYKTSAETAKNAVKKNNIKRLVLLSSIGAHLDGKTGPVKGLHQAEEILRPSVESFFALRPSFFMENFLSQIPNIQQAGSIFFPVPGKVSFPMIATEDIAASAVRVVGDSSWSGKKSLELVGPSDISFDEAARLIGKAVGKEVKHVQVTPEQATEAMLGMGLGKSFVDEIVEMYGAITSGYMTLEHPRSQAEAGPTSFEKFAQTAIAPALKQPA